MRLTLELQGRKKSTKCWNVLYEIQHFRNNISKLTRPTKAYESNAWPLLYKAHWKGFHSLRFFQMFLIETETAHIFKLHYAIALLRGKKKHESQLLDTFILIRTYPNNCSKRKNWRGYFQVPFTLETQKYIIRNDWKYIHL